MENQYIVNEEKYVDWVLHPVKGFKIQLFKMVWGVMAVVAFLLAIPYFMQNMYSYCVLFIAMGLFCTFQGYFRFSLLAKKQFSTIAAAYGMREWTRTVRFGSTIEIDDAGKAGDSYEYSDVRELRKVGDFYALVMDKGLSIRVAAEGFVNRSESDFIEFIRLKMPHIIIEGMEKI